MRIRLYLVVCLLFGALKSLSQISRLGENVQYAFTAQGTAGSGDNAPFWFTNNQYGLGTTDNFSGLARIALWRTIETDSIWFWRIGYGLDVASPINSENGYFCIQQAYADIEWKMLRLSLGQKERPSEFKNPHLSTGGMTLGTNARPIPQVRIEMPDFWEVPGTRGIFSFKGHLAYGMYTDAGWQSKFNAGTNNSYTSGSLFHSKALFLRFGNRELFPLEFSGGLEMACQFGGTGYNVQQYAGGLLAQEIPLGGNILNAFFPSGGDVNDENYSNAAGNQLGSWHMRLDWIKKSWNVGIYMEHFFEDHSQMFMQYGFWKDMLLGIEVNLPRNPFLTTFLYEYNTTMNQSGPLYHDKTVEVPLQISGLDDYYRNHIYGAWQMGGFVLGNPLLLSPIYNPYFGKQGNLEPIHNRMQVHHLGLMGKPSTQWAWRVMYTHQYSLGTYNQPTLNPCTANYFLLEATYTPSWSPGLSMTASYGHNDGNLLGNSNGAMLTLKFNGWLNRTQW